MDRRKFLINSCSACFALAGGSVVASLLQSCSPMPVFKIQAADNKAVVPIENFLQSDYLIVSPEKYSYNVAVIKSGTEYRALIMKCTHADNPVRFDGKTFSCNLHGSVFDKSGNVEKGPAEKSLFQLIEDKKNDSIIIHLI